MARARTVIPIATLAIVVASLVSAALTKHEAALITPEPATAPAVAELTEPEPVIYALDVDEAVYANTIATFEGAGFEAPEFLARFHTTPAPCKGNLGLHVLTSDGVSTVHVCRMYHNPDMIGTARERTMKHEVAHVWIDQNVSDEQIAAFMEIRGLTLWSDIGQAWGELGAEHAAEILLWGMTGETRNINPQIDDSDLDNLRAAFEILVHG